MSGFIVIYNKNKHTINPNLLNKLMETLKVHGPDKSKTYIDNYIGMGHALFKTTYEAKYENQPATLDGKIWIVCSARIDDREYLVAKLGLKREVNLSKTPDSELILHAYRKWGERCVEHLLGDFAFVIWDNRKNMIFCGTDIFALKQLYYAETKNCFIISNNLYTLLQHPEVTKEVNDRTMAYYLMFGLHHWADKSITSFKDIQALPPANFLKFSNKRMEVKRYWFPSDGRPILKYKNDDDYVEHFLEVFRYSILDRVRTDSIVLPMSGGMDSTSIAAMLGEMKNKGVINSKLQAVTAVIETEGFQCTERPYAQSVANYLNMPIHFEINHEIFLAQNYHIMTNFPISVLPEEFQFSTLPKRYASYGRVSLEGNGSDELFLASSFIESLAGGEDFFKLMQNIFLLKNKYGQFPPFGLRTFLKEKFHREKSFKSPNHFEWLNPVLKKEIQGDLLEKSVFSALQFDTRQRHKPIVSALLKPSWIRENLILYPEFTGVEHRQPFLDRRMIEFMLSLPEQPWAYKKHLLRTSMKNKLPEPVLKRPKEALHGFFEAQHNLEKSQWIHSWKPSPSLEKYIDIESVRNTQNLFSNHRKSFLNVRMIALERWLDNLNTLNKL